MAEAVIGVSVETKEKLEKLKGESKTYDRMIRELMDFWEERH